MLRSTNSTNDAVARRTQLGLAAAQSTVATDPPSNTEIGRIVGIHSAPEPTQRFDVSSPERKKPSGVTPARQGKSGLWSSLEIEELKRLVSSNIGTNGKITWRKVEAAWKD